VQAPAPVDGVVNGNITLVGGGDPLLSGDWYPSSALDRYPVFNHTSLDALAAQVAASGVQRVTGVVVGDGSRWPEERYNTAWAEGVAGIEAGPIGALLVNDARVEGGAFRYDDPVAAAVIEFERALQRAGIVIDGGAVVAAAPASTIADINSAPLRDVITEMLHTSDNNTAEMLLREIGLAAAGAGTTTAGTTVVLDVLAGLGLDTSGIELFDGSGLAPGNRITCDALLTVLATAPDAVVDALAVAGRSGSLIDVYADTEWDGRLRAKTGTLGNPPYDQDPPAVKALVGELLMGNTAESMRFALILNQYQIDDQSRYRPLWGELLDILDTGPDGYTVADFGPR
jgi:D-alanyl-D-alanine carboxypeptidase/D-alanyl-D-alanine-endopeptidase (penicillin-binding protein 4)